MEGDIVVGKSKRKTWVILLVVFLAVMAGLVVAIVLIRINKGSAGSQADGETIVSVEDIDNAKEETLSVCDGIRNEYLNGEITFTESKQKYKKASGEGDKLHRIYLASCYADFVYQYTRNATWSAEILKETEGTVNNINNATVKIDYYSAIRYFYEKLGEWEQVSKYSDLLSELGVNDIEVEVDETSF